MNSFAIEIKNLWKTYKTSATEIQVLSGLELKIESGDSVAITGPSGSGKSTLLNLVAGLMTPDAGKISISGQNIAEMNEQQTLEFRSGKIGIVFQHHHLLMQCTALENVLLPTLPLKTDPESAEKKARELLEKMGLSDRCDHFPAMLSGGEQHRVAIARALINEPEIVLADEPTGSLEPGLGEEIVKLLTQSGNYTLLVVSHAGYVAAMMNKSFRLEKGKLENLTR
jgi:ABC-type lipoprotein export system ATPase subunit